MNRVTSRSLHRQHLRIRQVQERYQISRSTVYDWIRDRGFPPPLKLSPGTACWDEAELDAFDEKCAAKREVE